VRADGAIPLVVGGDCTITLGVVAGYGRDVRLVYVDGDMDLGSRGNTDTPGSGILDSTGVSHLLGDGAPELTSLGAPTPASPGDLQSADLSGSEPAGAGVDGWPLIEPGRLTLVGGDPRETSDAGRQYLTDRGVVFQEGPALAADPAGTARRALAAVGAGPLLVHFDVDVIDSGDLPLANFPHYDSGVSAAQAFACLRGLGAEQSLAGMVLTEVNPTHDPSGRLLDRYLDGIVGALSER
jgi:arginase